MHLFKQDLRNEQIDHSLGFFALQTRLLWIKVLTVCQSYQGKLEV